MAGATFIHYQLFGPNAVLLLAGAAYCASELLKDHLPQLRVRQSHAPAIFRWGLGLSLTILSGWSILQSGYQSEISPGVYATLDWLRPHTSATSGYD